MSPLSMVAIVVPWCNQHEDGDDDDNDDGYDYAPAASMDSDDGDDDDDDGGYDYAPAA